MEVKNFERIVNFVEYQSANGDTMYLPLVEITFITSNSNQSFSLMFDTGASRIYLRSDLYPLLGINSLDECEQIPVGGIGGSQIGYKHTANLEIFGKVFNCPIIFAQIAHHELYHGLLGRDPVFSEFGFGFWEYSKELFITDNP